MSRHLLAKVRYAWNLLLIAQILAILAAVVQGEFILAVGLIAYALCSGIQQSDLTGRMILGYKAYVCDDPVVASKVDINDSNYGKKINGSFFIDLLFWIGFALVSLRFSPQPLVSVILCAIQVMLVVQQFKEKPKNEIVIVSHCIPIATILVQISSSHPNYALFGSTAIVLVLLEGITIANIDNSLKGFTRERRSEQKSSSLTDVMNTARKVLTDQQFQNSREPKELRSMFAVNDLSIDRDLDKYGFPSNPIRVNGIIGSLAYISRLADELDKVGFIGHRIGSFRDLDAYEIVSEDGHDWRIIFIDMYWDKRDVIAPSSLCLVDNHGGALSAINQYCPNFPKEFYSKLIEATSYTLGIAAVKTHLRDIDFDEFERPDEHEIGLESMKEALRSHGKFLG